MTTEQKACRKALGAFQKEEIEKGRVPWWYASFGFERGFKAALAWQSQQPTPTEQVQDGSTLNLSGQAGLVDAMEEMERLVLSPANNEFTRTWNSAISRALAIIYQHLQKGNPHA